MQATTLNKQQCTWLGLLVCKHKPELATELMESYYRETAAETDISLITHYFQKFCEIRGLQPQEITGPLYKSRTVDIRRQFIAVMLHLYLPNVYHHPKAVMGKTGVGKKLAEVLGLSKPHVAMVTREAIFFERNYEDFRTQVAETLKELTC